MGSLGLFLDRLSGNAKLTKVVGAVPLVSLTARLPEAKPESML